MHYGTNKENPFRYINISDMLFLCLNRSVHKLVFISPGARTPDCEGMQDMCRCHKSYTDATNGMQRICLKRFSEKKNWKGAFVTCANEYSTLVHNRVPDSFFEHFRNESIDIIWIGIRKKLGFYIVEAPVESVLKNASALGFGWEAEEPLHECVALNISSGRLVTRDCYNEHEYICQNAGFPVYPISNSLACPKEWLFYYQYLRKDCIALSLF
ncbi:hypothetical protein HNY73_009937 [Argiope bruennichi]|uniref:C-type lectin domain-containing protein n=1 Tax=Argiope bruennichi TaxID=94029 RepID=A0A8T0FDW8_ARGBR|nr:hypothetical protein HNY73_009937 [Argiope bruennichi]